MMEKDGFFEKKIYFVIAVLIFVVFILLILPPFRKSSEAEVTNILVEKEKITLIVGDNYYLKYIVSPSKITDADISFTSSNKNIAIVDQTGKVTALKKGNATIIIKSKKGISASCEIEVINKEIPINSISLNKNDLSLYVGEFFCLKADISPLEATNQNLIWTSSDQSVVSVTNGKVVALNPGTALITAKTNNGKIAICDVEVGIGINRIAFNEEMLKLTIGSKLKLEYIINPNNATEKPTFSSSDPNIVDVEDNGVVTAKKIGTAIITAKSRSGASGKINISVKSKNVQIAAALSPLLNNERFNEGGNVLLFGSDYQGENRSKNFRAILENVKNNGINPSLISILGDYNSSGYNVNTSMSGLKEANSIIKSVFPNSGALFIQGNHDDAENIYLTKTGGYEADNYVLYVVNEDDFPWKGASKSKVTLVVNNLDKYLNEIVDLNIRKPVFFITHLPLHYSSRGDNKYAYLLIDVLNKYGDKLDIFVMFGHNHSRAYDDCLGGTINYIKRGATMKHYASSQTALTTIKFTYLNAGYIGFARNTDGLVSCDFGKVNSSNTLTMSSFKIENARIILERYSSNAKIFTDIIERVSHN